MRKSRNLDDVEVNMTPMIDVVFLLIIFFMIFNSSNFNDVISV